jgi:hypothetical protein
VAGTAFSRRRKMTLPLAPQPLQLASNPNRKRDSVL